MIEKLRSMIRDMEKARPVDDVFSGLPKLPPVPRLGLSSKVRDVAPASCSITDRERFRVIEASFSCGTPEELRKPSEEALPAFRSLEPRLPGLDGWLYLDIETTGLFGAATVAFLVGFGEWVDGDFVVTQLFLRDRSDEEFLMEEVGRRMAGRNTLVTFNGKAFDVPMLWGRFAVCGMRPPAPPAAHLDLLSLVRNLGRRPQYGQSLKEAVRRFTGAVRDGDIPGNMIPALYYIYERDGDPSILDPVVKHNRLDILDMACLVSVLCHVVAGEDAVSDCHALGGAGKLHLRKGNLDLARRCLTAALAKAPHVEDAQTVEQNRLLGHVLRKQGDYVGGAEAFEKVVASGEAKDEDYLWLARCYELGPRDIAKSREVVASAIARHEARGTEPPPSLLKRMRRLDSKIS
jgi:uncharacterized protein YprB with RNaseH-like and TPR domain